MTTSRVVRAYAVAASALGLSLAWLGVSTRPLPAPQGQETTASAADLAAYENRLRADAALVALLARRERGTAPPTVRVVPAPPVTTTRTS